MTSLLCDGIISGVGFLVLPEVGRKRLLRVGFPPSSHLAGGGQEPVEVGLGILCTDNLQ